MIVCDHRENESGIPKLLEYKHIPVERDKLELGDYEIVGQGTLIVERKEAKDFIKSMQDERLNNQLYHLATNYPFVVLVVEGYVSKAAKDGNMTSKQVQGAVASAILKRPPDGERGVVSVVFTDDIYETAMLLSRLRVKLITDGAMVRLPRVSPKIIDPIQRSVSVLASLPLIGEKRARSLLSHPRLNTLAKVLHADEKTLQEVDGIGKKIARGIVDLANKEYEQNEDTR